MKKDFKDTIEDVKLAIKTSAKIAIAESKALGLPITYLKDGKVIKEYADGTIEILEVLEVTGTQLNEYKKGETIYVKK